MDQSAEQTVLGAVFAVVARTGQDNVIVLDFNFKVGVNGLRQSSFGAFDSHYVVINGHGHAGGDGDRGFTYS